MFPVSEIPPIFVLHKEIQLISFKKCSYPLSGRNQDASIGKLGSFVLNVIHTIGVLMNLHEGVKNTLQPLGEMLLSGHRWGKTSRSLLCCQILSAYVKGRLTAYFAHLKAKRQHCPLKAGWSIWYHKSGAILKYNITQLSPSVIQTSPNILTSLNITTSLYIRTSPHHRPIEKWSGYHPYGT